MSQSFSTAKKNNSTCNLKLISLKGAVINKFKDYLYGAEFVVKTDNNPLTYILNTDKLDATGQRWLATLSGFCFSFKFHTRVANRDAEALSRRPYDPETLLEDWTQLTSEGVKLGVKLLSTGTCEQLGLKPLEFLLQVFPSSSLASLK